GHSIREQNSQFAAGSFGQQPLKQEQDFTYTVTTQGRFTDPKEFENVILRTDDTGASLLLKDVARIELGAQDYSLMTSLNGQQNAAFGVYLQPGANALDTAEAVSKTLERLSKNFPSGMTYKVPYDTTKFVRVSIEEVIHTFFEALILVVLVVFIFLQNWRATLIPVLAIPVSLVGTFAGMYMLGFSINLLTLFGMVLAIGIVVDDAIVVIENVERVMATDKIGPREATIKAMEEVTGPIIAIVLVLCAVFVPVGFLGGLAGEMYKQFAITIAVSVVISGIVALTLSPALCALLLKPGHHEPAAPFRAFNRVFDKLTNGYTAGVRFFLKRSAVGLLLFGAMIAVMVLLFNRVPSSLVPNEDQGYVINAYFLPPAASLTRTEKLTAAGMFACHAQAADVTVKLGSAERVTRLFAYPNNCNVICYRDWTLEQTAEHYLGQSLQRDGYDKAKVTVHREQQDLYAKFTEVPEGYGKPLEQLLKTGELAYAGAKLLNKDGKWQYNWSLFLPLGMALDNRKSVELLHFPPDYSLTQAQDYLESSTTNRWADLLTQNGIGAAQTPAFQTIIDIAPIAAPANAGSALEGVYSYFNAYQTQMVMQLTAGEGGQALPMVAFGSPVRSWVKQQYGVSLDVLGLAQISPAAGQQVAVLGANHPSYI
ncbi:predicted protein, partial [Nematostella vectensis]